MSKTDVISWFSLYILEVGRVKFRRCKHKPKLYDQHELKSK